MIDQCSNPDELRRFLAEHPELQSSETVEKLHAEIVSKIVVDPARGRQLASVARWMADILADEYSQGIADRSEAHVSYAAADYAGALRLYESAIERFERLGRETELAKTLTAAMQSLIYLGQTEKSIQFAARARSVFERNGDELRLARLDSNVGNIYYRQDRYAEAHNFYRTAHDRMIALGRRQDAAAVLCNLAVASTGLAKFDAAAAEYSQSRQLAEQEGLRSLVAEIDYNVAYLHFLRGDYMHALELYKTARVHSEAIGDGYHASLCDLDQAEVYLHLNLADEGVTLAKKAAFGFEQLGMAYEQAKALAFMGAGEHARRNSRRALILFGAARRMFVGSRNRVWPAMIDLYRSVLLRDLGQIRPALKLARRSRSALHAEALPHKRALIDLLFAEIYLHSTDPKRALCCVARAVRGLSSVDHPTVFFHAEYLKGRILGAQEHPHEAYASFLRAAALLESLRCRLAGDELKVAFVQNKLEVYSELMLLAHRLLPSPHREQAMFDFVERSKSRSLADRVALPESDPGESVLSTEFLAIREELNALYREIDSREAERRDPSVLWNRVRPLENRLKHFIAERASDLKPAPGIADWIPVRLETATESLPRHARMIEYFIAKDRLWVGVIGHGFAEFKELGALDPTYSSMRFLMFQLSRSRREAGRTHHPVGQAATMAHLEQLYKFLITPIECWIDVQELVIVPHGLLHQLPFHALYNGSSFLIDHASISYAPSATVFSSCQRKICRSPERSLLMGLPDDNSAAIADEIQAIARFLPAPLAIVGRDATEEVLFREAGSCRFVHIATHGQFRRDNPMFSSIRLGESRVNVFDLSRLKLDAELVTLSGCSTGVSRVFSGDEMVGLARGLMHAGARSVLLTLWDVHDPSTARLMTCFYQNLSLGGSPSRALREAMLSLRKDWPEPFYWAPFMISGCAVGQR